MDKKEQMRLAELDKEAVFEKMRSLVRFRVEHPRQEADSVLKPKTNKQHMDEVYAELDEKRQFALIDAILASHAPKLGETDSRLDLYTARMKRLASNPAPKPIHDGSIGLKPK